MVFTLPHEINPLSANLEVLSKQLKSWDVQPVEAREGETALQELQVACDSGNTPGMIVTDMCMPGMDGSELCRKIKTDERFQDIPLVVLTSIGRPGDARRFAEQGFNAYLNKHVRKSGLFDTLVTIRFTALYFFQKLKIIIAFDLKLSSDYRFFQSFPGS